MARAAAWRENKPQPMAPDEFGTWYRAQRAAHRAQLHDAHVRIFRTRRVQWRIRYQRDREFAIYERVRAALRRKSRLYPKLGDYMRAALNRRATSNVVETICGYTIEALRLHLETLFTDGMSWELFATGAIHIDHIRPQSTFDLNDLEQVRQCWALCNLQPLWAEDNLAKGVRWSPDL
jgi:hypothetical protein